MTAVLRWGRSAYETDESLGHERAAAEALGLTWSLQEDRSRPAIPAEILVVNSGVRVTEDVLVTMRGGLVVATTSGFDHIDIHAAQRLGVSVSRSPMARRDAVVEHALGLLIGLMRRQPAMNSAAAEGRWTRGELPALAPIGLRGATIGVVGLGVIGRRIASVLTELGADVVGFDPVARPPGVRVSELNEALPMLDAVTLHCSLSPTSRDLVNAAALNRLPSHAVVVNTSRGDVLDIEHAVDRVRGGFLRGVGCDVFPVEPYPELARAGQVEGVWLSPHASGYTHDLGDRVAASVAEALEAWVLGEPQPAAVV